jgi:hypothetical protein
MANLSECCRSVPCPPPRAIQKCGTPLHFPYLFALLTSNNPRTMTSLLRSPFALSAISLAAGMVFGRLLREENPRASSAPPPSTTANAPAQAPSSAQPETQSLANHTEPSTFSTLPSDQQVDTLIRISKQAPNSPSLQLLVAKLAADLPQDALERLLSQLAQRKDGPFFATSVLAERLAAINPDKALTLASETKSKDIAEAALNALLRRDASEALKAWATLPKDLEVDPTVALSQGLATPGGSFKDAVNAIRSVPELLENVGSRGAQKNWQLTNILGALTAKAAAEDPALALAELRAAAAGMVNDNPKRNPNASDLDIAKQRDALVATISGKAVNTLRSTSTSVASDMFDALKDTEKHVWSFSIEAVTRFKQSGTETAISFAEKQASKDNMSSAASGVWWALANQDRAAALSWIESLPPGAFREGTLKSVMMDAWNRTKSWGDPEIATGAAAALLSRGSQLDYYTTMLSDRHFGYNDGRSRADFIASLPLSPQERVELERRIAPVKPR